MGFGNGCRRPFARRPDPLRERGKNIKLLAQSLLDELNDEHGTETHFPTATKDAQLSYRWPGNVRELKNYVQRAHIMLHPERTTTPLLVLYSYR